MAATACTAQLPLGSQFLSGVPGITMEMSQNIWVMYESRNHVYWFGSNGNGAYSYDGKTLVRYTTADGLCSDQIRGIQADSMGNVYFDTPKGVSKYDGKRFVTLKPEHSTSNQWMLQTGDLWFKGNGDVVGAYRYDGSNLYKLNFSELDGRKYDRECAVYSIYRDYNGHMWFGTEKGGVARYNGKKLEWIVEDELKHLKDGRVPAIRSILRDVDGWYWLSHIAYRYKVSTGAGGRMVYQKARYVTDLQRAKMQLPYYTSAVVDGQTIWMTTYNEGVWRCDSGNLTQYPLTYNGRKVLPISVYKDRSDHIWVTTDNAGVYVLRDDKFVRFVP
jgi:ligand-binding sensor domain-containing protein